MNNLCGLHVSKMDGYLAISDKTNTPIKPFYFLPPESWFSNYKPFPIYDKEEVYNETEYLVNN